MREIDNDDRQVDIICNEVFDNDPKIAEGEIEAAFLDMDHMVEQNIVENFQHIYGIDDGTDDEGNSDFSIDDYDLIGSEAD